MPALNIRFTDDELAALKRRAEAEGRPVTRLVHDAAVGETARARLDSEVMAAGAHVIDLSRDLLKRLADR
jgi:uncharacterized protein (DUF1778 family)